MRVTASLGVIVTILALCLFADPMSGAFEDAIEVWQPIVLEERIELSPVTFVKYLGDRNPGYSASLVCAESRVIDEMGNAVNRNAASFLGLSAGYDPFHSSGKLFGDTVRVFLDLSALSTLWEAPPSLKGWSMDGAVLATVECMFTAAWADRSGWEFDRGVKVEANFVALEIRGSSEYERLGGVFSFSELGPLPRTRRFY